MDCCICLEEIGSDNVKKLNCAHSFHTRCINIWFIKKRGFDCPLCHDNTSVSQDILVHIEETRPSTGDLPGSNYIRFYYLALGIIKLNIIIIIFLLFFVSIYMLLKI